MAIDLANDWLRKDNATASSTVYYGYSVIKKETLKSLFLISEGYKIP